MKESTMQNLQDTIENEAKHKADHAAKLAELAAAVANKENAITSAAGGAVVKADDLLKLETAIRTADAAAAISGSILAGATSLRHQAEIDRWHEEAATLAAREDAVITARIAAGHEVDVAVASLRTALEKFDAAGDDLIVARQAVAVFDSAAASRASGNPVLAARTQGEHPQAGRGHAGRGNLLAQNGA